MKGAMHARRRHRPVSRNEEMMEVPTIGVS